jgi:hypothetical protein
MSEFRQALEAGNARRLRGLWAKLFPHLPQLASDEQAEIVMHRARTEAQSVSFRHRAYSHRWLSERGLPSGLPDELKPKAERVYPIVVAGVGISVNSRSSYMRAACDEIRGSMEVAVEDCFAERRTDPAFVSERMREAKARTVKALFG